VALGSVSTGALSSNMKKSILSIIKEMVDYTIYTEGFTFPRITGLSFHIVRKA